MSYYIAKIPKPVTFLIVLTFSNTIDVSNWKKIGYLIFNLHQILCS